MNIYYFAYGSNMSSVRLKKRISSVQVIDTAVLNGYSLKWNKYGKDGSAKCNIENHETQYVLGVVYQIRNEDILQLDNYEVGYDRMSISVNSIVMNNEYSVITYISQKTRFDIYPFKWYKNHVLIGAIEHKLPNDYIKLLRDTKSIN